MTMSKKNVRIMLYISEDTHTHFKKYAADRGFNVNNAFELAIEEAMRNDLLAGMRSFSKESVLAAVLSCFKETKEVSDGRVKMYAADGDGDDGRYIIYPSFKRMNPNESMVVSVKGGPITALLNAAERENRTPLVLEAIQFSDKEQMVGIINVNDTPVAETKKGGATVYRSSNNTLFIRVKTDVDKHKLSIAAEQCLPKTLYSKIKEKAIVLWSKNEEEEDQ